MHIDEEAFWAQQIRYWRSPDQRWRTRARIDPVRERVLAHCLTITPDVKKGIYPFKEVRLSRPDVEWLVTSSGVMNLLSEDTTQRNSYLDLRAADLRGMVLEFLPLPGLLGGLGISAWNSSSVADREMAAAHMEQVVLNNTYLAGAHLCGAH